MSDVENKNEEIAVQKRGFDLSLNIAIIVIAVTIGWLLTVGLVSGLVFRKINVCDPESGAQGGDKTTLTSITSTTTRITTTTTTSPSTTPSTSTTTTNSPTTPSTTTTTTPTTSTTLSTTRTTITTTTPTTPSTTTTTTTTTSQSTTPSTSTTSITPSTTISTVTSTTTSDVTNRTLPTLSTLSTTFKPINVDNITFNYDVSNYNLKMNIKFDPSAKAVDETDFDGSVDITFRINSMTSDLFIHASTQLMVLDPITLTNLANNVVITASQHRPLAKDFYYIQLPTAVNTGNYKLSISFKNNQRSLFGNRGMFASRYLDDVVERTLVATVFSPNEARKVFPCFDEPHLKATFDITIQHPWSSYALSNADELSKVAFNTTNDKYIVTRFKTTPKISTYLVGWIIVPDMFTYEEARTINGIPIRVYAKSEAKKEKLLVHALDVAKKSVDFFERTYLMNSDAVLSKIHLVAVPDFPYEAMETWGLIMLRETSVLYSPERDPAITKQNIALEVALEIAHMWFGNLVTCAKWDEYWFSKAAANYLKYKAVDSIFPDWMINDQFITEETVPAMWDDGYESSHPLQFKLETTSQIISSFDKITSGKGAAIMRMVESVVGSSSFLAGLKNYLNKNKFSVGVISDFYNGFVLPASMSSITPEKFILPWVLQMNYPLLKVTFERGQNSTTFKFEQERFYLSISDEEYTPIFISPYNYTWPVLIKCRAGGVSNDTGDENQHLQGTIDEVEIFLDKKSAQITINGRLYTWIKCNTDFNSYYTTQYSPLIYEGIYAAIEKIPQDTYSIADCANIIHVSYQLAYKGLISYAVSTFLSYYFELKERNYVPWKVFTYHLDLIADLLEHRSSFKQMAGFGAAFGEYLALDFDIYQESNETKPHLTYLLESTVLEFLCRLQDGRCLIKMTEKYSQIPSEYFFSPNTVLNPLPANIRASVYKYHLQNTYNYNDWFDVYQLYELSADAQEKNNALIGLTASRLTWVLNLYLTEILENSSPVRRQDVFALINAVSRNPSGRHLAWYFYRHYYNELREMFTLDDFDFGQSIKYITSTFEDKFFLEEMGDFFISHPNEGSSYFARIQAIDVAMNNIEWVKYRERDITDNFFPKIFS